MKINKFLPCISYSVLIIAFFLGHTSPVAAQLFSIDETFAISGEYQDNDITLEGPFNMAGFIELPLGELIVFGDKKLTASILSQNDMLVTKLNQDGTHNTEFANNGVFRFDYNGSYDKVTNVRVLPDNKLLVVGATSVADNMHGFLIRLHPDGSFDNTFHENGIKIMPRLTTNGQESINDIFVTSEGIYLAYFKGHNTYPARQYAVLCKTDLNGNIDESFGENGYMEFPNESDDPTHEDFGLLPTNDGNIIASYRLGAENKIRIWRVSLNGTIDTDFGVGGKFEVDGNEFGLHVAETNDNRYIVTATIETMDFDGFRVYCLDQEGQTCTDFGVNGVFEYDSSIPSSANYSHIYPDGSILSAGSRGGNAALYKLTPQGELDLAFHPLGFQNFNQGPITVLKSSPTGNHFYAITRRLILAGDNLLLKNSLIKIDGQVSTTISQSENENLIIYPNPTSDHLTIEGTVETPTSIKIIDHLGRIVLSEQSIRQINISQLPKGSYWLIINLTNKTISKKIIKK